VVDCRGGFIKTRTDFLGLRANILRLALAAFICPGLLAQNAHDAGELPEISEARALEISRELANRRAGIEEVQSSIGIYDQSLVEAYTDLARLYEEVGDYENAAAIFLDALQVARVNTGLYSHEQLPLLRLLIQNELKAREWRSADDFYELDYLISSRVFAPVDNEYLVAIEAYGDWKLRLIRENLLDQTTQSLLQTAGEVSYFYDRVIDRVEQETGLLNKRLLAVLYNKTEVDMTLARYVASMPYTTFQGTASPYINQTRCRNQRSSGGQVVRQCYIVQVENPRYRQSQREAKRFAMSRHTRAISRSIGKLEDIKNNNGDLTLAEKERIDGQIGELVVKSEQLVRASDRPFLF
jgi:hypothetical protein